MTIEQEKQKLHLEKIKVKTEALKAYTFAPLGLFDDGGQKAASLKLIELINQVK